MAAASGMATCTRSGRTRHGDRGPDPLRWLVSNLHLLLGATPPTARDWAPQPLAPEPLPPIAHRPPASRCASFYPPLLVMFAGLSTSCFTCIILGLPREIIARRAGLNGELSRKGRARANEADNRAGSGCCKRTSGTGNCSADCYGTKTWAHLESRT